MAYLPLFLSLREKKILLVGGGKVATTKLLHLLQFTDAITIIAENFSSEIVSIREKFQLAYTQRYYQEGDIVGFDIVVVALDDIALQRSIFEESRKYAILCNVVDIVECCDFIFPAYIKEGDLTIAISTSGSSPTIAKELKGYIQRVLPKNIAQFLEEMRLLRESLPKGKERMQMLRTKAELYIKSWS